jgi:hypothetical protein
MLPPWVSGQPLMHVSAAAALLSTSGLALPLLLHKLWLLVLPLLHPSVQQLAMASVLAVRLWCCC